MRVSRLFFSAVFVLLSLIASGCGVKGDPLPPERPPELGSGKPTYKRAFQNQPPSDAETYLDEDPYDDKQDDEQDEK